MDVPRFTGTLAQGKMGFSAMGLAAYQHDFAPPASVVVLAEFSATQDSSNSVGGLRSVLGTVHRLDPNVHNLRVRVGPEIRRAVRIRLVRADGTPYLTRTPWSATLLFDD